MIFRASLPFLAFVVWLLAVPMDGFLVNALNINHPLLFFLFPHIVAMLFIGINNKRRFLPFATVAGGAVAVVTTLLLPLFADKAAFLLILAGIGSAFLSIRTYCHLMKSPSPPASAAVALVCANLFLFLFAALPVTVNAKFMLAAMLLLISVLPLNQILPMEKGTADLKRFLPFAFIFQLISGFMYGSLFRHYEQAALLPGIELLFYIAAVGAALFLLRRQHTLLLVLAIVAAMFAFAAFLVSSVVAVNISCFFIQVAAGFYDFYFITLLLLQRDTVRAFGYGVAVSCFGIICGKLIAINIAEVPTLLVAASNIVLTVSVLLLYRQMQAEQKLDQESLRQDIRKEFEEQMEGEQAVEQGLQQLLLMLPPNLNRLFSSQEKAVLNCIINGKTYKEAADELDISESTVKTYMKRIYIKLDVNGKKQLLTRLDAFIKYR